MSLNLSSLSIFSPAKRDFDCDLLLALPYFMEKHVVSVARLRLSDFVVRLLRLSHFPPFFPVFISFSIEEVMRLQVNYLNHDRFSSKKKKSSIRFFTTLPAVHFPLPEANGYRYNH